MRHIWPYIWWCPWQKYRIHTVYTYMVLANPIHTYTFTHVPAVSTRCFPRCQRTAQPSLLRWLSGSRQTRPVYSRFQCRQKRVVIATTEFGTMHTGRAANALTLSWGTHWEVYWTRNRTVCRQSSIRCKSIVIGNIRIDTIRECFFGACISKPAPNTQLMSIHI
jgi:hypothetical protein